MYSLLKYVPKRHLSWLVGALVRFPLPGPLGPFSVKLFARLAGVDVAAASKPLSEYGCISDFFVRDLQTGLRPIGRGLVSPVDGTLRSSGPIRDGLLPQVKGRTYRVDEFLRDANEALAYADGTFLNFYLSPKDYHHIHSPVDGVLLGYRHIPGKLWPVNDWSISNVENLFAVNERVALFIKTEFGMLTLVMVGATNVGRIALSHADLLTNTSGSLFSRREICHVMFDEPKNLAKGERVGTFFMGSSVVLLLSPEASKSPLLLQGNENPPCPVLYGQELPFF